MNERLPRFILYSAWGLLGIIGIAILAHELVTPIIVRKAHAQELIPALNDLISDRSLPVWRFQVAADRLFYNLISPFFFFGLIAALSALGFRNRMLLGEALSPLIRFGKQLPPLYRWTILGLLGAMVVGQLVDRSRMTFPFVSWTMYGNVNQHPTVYYKIEGRIPEGNVVHVNPCRLFRSVARPIWWRLWKYGAWIQENPSEEFQHLYDELLYSLGRQYYRDHGKRLSKITVRKYVHPPVHIQARTDSSAPHERVVRQLEMGNSPGSLSRRE